MVFTNVTENVAVLLQQNITTIATTTEMEHVPGINFFTCFLIMLCFGAIAAIISKTIAAPIERIKLIQQCLYQDDAAANDETSNKLISRNGEKLKFGMYNCAKYIYRNEGILAFWRGNWANCVRYFPKFACDMAFKEQLKDAYRSVINPAKSKNFGLVFASKWLAGVTASFLSTLIVYPLEFVRTRLVTDMGKDDSEREFEGIIDCIKKTVKKGGFFALYSGLLVTLIGEVIYRGFKYGLYDSLKGPTKDMILGEDNDNAFATFFYYFLFGWAVSAVAATISFPFDTVRRVLMVDTNAPLKQYTGFIDCFQKLYREFGIIRFYRGCLANIVRSWSSGFVLALFDLFVEQARKSDAVNQCYTLYD